MLLLVETSRPLRTGRSSARAYSKQSGVPVLVSALWYKLVLLRGFGYWFKGHAVSGWPSASAVPLCSHLGWHPAIRDSPVWEDVCPVFVGTNI